MSPAQSGNIHVKDATDGMSSCDSENDPEPRASNYHTRTDNERADEANVAPRPAAEVAKKLPEASISVSAPRAQETVDDSSSDSSSDILRRVGRRNRSRQKMPKNNGETVCQTLESTTDVTSAKGTQWLALVDYEINESLEVLDSPHRDAAMASIFGMVEVASDPPKHDGHMFIQVCVCVCVCVSVCVCVCACCMYIMVNPLLT